MYRNFSKVSTVEKKGMTVGCSLGFQVNGSLGTKDREAYTATQQLLQYVQHLSKTRNGASVCKKFSSLRAFVECPCGAAIILEFR